VTIVSLPFDNLSNLQNGQLHHLSPAFNLCTIQAEPEVLAQMSGPKNEPTGVFVILEEAIASSLLWSRRKLD